MEPQGLGGPALAFRQGRLGANGPAREKGKPYPKPMEFCIKKAVSPIEEMGEGFRGATFPKGEPMTEVKILDQAHHLMMGSFVEKGSGLHFTELGAALGLEPEAAKTVLHDLVATGIPAWLYPDTDHLASFPPFNNLPTHIRITVDGIQQWWAQ